MKVKEFHFDHRNHASFGMGKFDQDYLWITWVARSLLGPVRALTLWSAAP